MVMEVGRFFGKLRHVGSGGEKTFHMTNRKKRGKKGIPKKKRGLRRTERHERKFLKDREKTLTITCPDKFKP